MSYTYRLEMYPITGKAIGVQRTQDGVDGIAFVPFHPDNTDYQRFKTDLANGARLNDASGNPITGSALTTFINTLP